MSFYIALKKLVASGGSQEGHMCHIQIALWVSGSSASTGVTHFQPWQIWNCKSFMCLQEIEWCGSGPGTVAIFVLFLAH